MDNTLVDDLSISIISIPTTPSKSKVWYLPSPGNRFVSKNKNISPLLEAVQKWKFTWHIIWWKVQIQGVQNHIIQKVCKHPYNQVILLVSISKDTTVLISHTSHHHTKNVSNQTKIGILGNPHLIQCQLRLLSLILLIHLIWKVS